jgi:hypothetical protein
MLCKGEHDMQRRMGKEKALDHGTSFDIVLEYYI